MECRKLCILLSIFVIFGTTACNSDNEDDLPVEGGKSQGKITVEQADIDPQLKKEIESLVSRLGRKERQVSFDAIDALVKMGEPAIPALIQALNSEDGGVRMDASAALGGIGEPAVPALTEVLRKGDAAVRADAAFTLVRMGKRAKDAVPALIQALKDQEVNVRGYAAMALGEIGEFARDAVPELIDALEDKEIRSSVAQALARIAPYARDQMGQAVPELIMALGEADKQVRFAASDALVAMGESAVPALTQKLNDGDAQVRRIVAGILGQIGEGARAAVPVLIDRLENDPDERVRAVSAVALGQIGAPETVPTLIRILERKNGQIDSDAISALGEIGEPAKPAVPLLIQIADEDKNWHVRREAVIALGKIGDPSAIPVLIQSLVGKLLFSLEMELPRILEGPQMPEALQREFEKHAITPFGITTVMPGREWMTKDKERAYLIMKENDKLNIYEDMGQEVRSSAAEALAQIGEPAVLALIEVLNHPNTVAGVEASAALRKIGTPEAIKAAEEFWENLGKR